MTRAATAAAAMVLGLVVSTTGMATEGRDQGLVAHCRQVLSQTPEPRGHYLRRELFNYEMAFISKAPVHERRLMEENLRETCLVVSRGRGSGPARVVQAATLRAGPSVQDWAEPGNQEAASTGAAASPSWQTPAYASEPDVIESDQGWGSGAGLNGPMGDLPLRSMLHLQ